MTADHLHWGTPGWTWPALAIAVVATVLLVGSYWRAPASKSSRAAAALLKATGLVLLLLCLVEPLLSTVRPKPGANLFVVLADNSQSLAIRDGSHRPTRGDQLRTLLTDNARWQERLSQDFDVRRYLFDSRLHATRDFQDLNCEGDSSMLMTSLRTVSDRYRGRPLAGILVFTDGNATDPPGPDFDWGSLPPIYPVPLGRDRDLLDIRLGHVAVSQSNFEETPVTVRATVESDGSARQPLVAQLLDEQGREIQRQTLTPGDGNESPACHFQFRPDKTGVNFYRVRVIAESELSAWDDPSSSSEATLANNSRQIAVKQDSGPYRVLYVAGRPNWEYKFLRRALQADREVDVVALIRIAKREAKFEFRRRGEGNVNRFFEGSEQEGDEETERYDKPVLLRIDTADANELRDGFPTAADQLFRYDAVILDDLEAEYFSQDQMTLLSRFVAQRGGGLLMLGGQESFIQGNYDRTPLGDLLPVYLHGPLEQHADLALRVTLTRDGWHQPWMRLRANEADEQMRLSAMPAFRSINQAGGVKPGAAILARASLPDGNAVPVMVAQRFGAGRAAALLIGDTWRWHLGRTEPQPEDLAKAWRQTVRWLVSEVPRRVEVTAARKTGDPRTAMELTVDVRDEEFAPQDNASVTLEVTAPGSRAFKLTAEPAEGRSGVYSATFVPREPGAFRAVATAKAADGSEIGVHETGWTLDPAADELRNPRPNIDLLTAVARHARGDIIDAARLDQFVRDLPRWNIQVTEPRIVPLWHRSWVFLLAVACLCAEWGIRRWKGLA